MFHPSRDDASMLFLTNTLELQHQHIKLPSDLLKHHRQHDLNNCTVWVFGVSSHAQLTALKKVFAVAAHTAPNLLHCGYRLISIADIKMKVFFQFALFLCSYSLTNSSTYVVRLVHFCFCSAKHWALSCHNLLCKVIASYWMFSFSFFFSI